MEEDGGEGKGQQRGEREKGEPETEIIAIHTSEMTLF